MDNTTLLVLNSGSSSLKVGLFAAVPDGVHLLYHGAAEGIGTQQEGRVWFKSAKGDVLQDTQQNIPGQMEAIRIVAAAISTSPLQKPTAIGHRVVHGGPDLREHQKITPQILQQLESASQFAPLHVPVALVLIREAQKLFPGIPQFACFDTAFHKTLPKAAARFAVPEKFWNAGVRRYGFHGLSCESILHTLGADVPPRLIVAHLGSGASVTAIANGLSVDTTMGLTPTGGIIMGTRPGDLDPGVLLYLLRHKGNNLEELEKLLDHESGLLGISGISNDMQLLHKAGDNANALLAIEMFTRSAKKAIAGFIAVLGGLDLLVFTGGIGEHDGSVRAEICNGLQFAGMQIAQRSNEQNLRTISSEQSQVRICVLLSDEEAQIARHVYRLLASS